MNPQLAPNNPYGLRRDEQRKFNRMYHHASVCKMPKWGTGRGINQQQKGWAQETTREGYKAASIQQVEKGIREMLDERYF